MQVIPSLLYNDLYKFTMLNAVYTHFPNATAKYKFKCRNANVNLLPYKDEIQNQVNLCDSLRFSPDEIKYLYSLGYFNRNFIRFLTNFKLDSNQITISNKNNNLDISINGTWQDTILWEIYILAIIHHVYTTSKYTKNEINCHYEEGIKRLNDKITLFNANSIPKKPSIVEFGTRRAYNTHWLEYVIKTLWNNKVIIGTSNMYYGMKYEIPVFGTHAHEWLCAGQALVHPLDSQKYMLNKWLETYPDGELDTALSDTLGVDKFCKDFDYTLATRYSAIRQDSGIPEQVADKMWYHYLMLNINPLTKTIMFSDNLNMKRVFELQKYCEKKINCSFGIGTNFSNDCGVEPLQNVIKLVKLNGRPVAKISNSSGKQMCEDMDYLNYLKRIIK